MNTYVINICVDTKTTDLYDKVAVNKFPLLISCENETRLTEILAGNEVTEYVKSMISKHLYDNAQYYIVCIDSNGLYNYNGRLRWELKSITKIDEYEKKEPV